MRSLTLLLSVLAAATAANLGGRVEKIMLPMRDGVKLHTVIAYPKDVEDGQKVTAIMDRSPYGADGLELINDIFLPFGFVTVGQDMRGTGQSEGNFSIWHSDADDSQDLGDWLVQQPWSNGKIFTFGASADGLGAFRVPDNQPAWLDAFYIIWSSSVGYEVVFPNGAYLEALADMWIRSTVPDEADEDLAIVEQNEYFNDWWTDLELTNKYWKVHGKSAFWAGWYDIFLVGNLAAYEGFNSQADESVRHTSRITVDPLGHCQGGAEYFTEDLVAGRTALAFMQSLEVFGVRPIERTNIKNVTFYVMSSNDDAGREAGQYWTSLEKFPTPVMTKFFLHSDGTVSNSAPAAGEGTASTSYLHDPANPIPTQGGNNLQLPCGPLDQRPVDSRADVLVFNTAPLTEELPLTGPIFATLYVSSDAVDTDFMVRVSDVYPTGEVRLIQDSAIRMRWRSGGEVPVYMEKGVVYKVEMSIWNTSYVIAPGHAVRVSISSSNWPRFNINPNNGILLANQKPTDANITATNSIYHSSSAASYISLPVVKKIQLPPEHNIKEQVKAAYPSVDWDKVMKEYPSKIDAYVRP